MDKNNVPVGVGLLIIKNNKVYLLHRTNTKKFKDVYAIPGGTLEFGESITDACIREASEELCINISKDNLKFLKVSYIKNDDYPYLFFVFLVENINQEIKNQEFEKHCHGDWFDINSIPENTMEFTKDLLKSYKSSKLYSEIGWE